MALKPEFPAASFQHVSQSTALIEGLVVLDNKRYLRTAQSMCENFCPHRNHMGSVSCTGIGEEGTAIVSVKRSQSRIAWVRARVARAFNAPCKVTYDAIVRTRARRGR
jgi:hypothetical protein